MRLPLTWLRDFVAYVGSAEELATRLGTSGFEIDAILRTGAPSINGNHANFIIGRVDHFEKHPNADRLRLCRVDTGDPELRQIVCGASAPGSIAPGVATTTVSPIAKFDAPQTI